MNITFLIGNGFDLGLGLNTRFEDFYPQYIKSKSKSKNILQFKEEISKNIKNWSDFEYQLGQYTLEFDENNWERFLDIKEDFENAFFRYLQKEQKRIINVEKKGKEFFEKAFSFDNILQYLPRSFSENIREMYDKDETTEYNFISFNYTNILDKIVKQLKKEQDELNDYYTTYDSLYTPIVYNTVQHVHGTLNEYPLIGVDNGNQIANEKLKNIDEVTEYMIKSLMNRTTQSGNERRTINIINKSDCVFVYGLSLGATDLRWWKKLVELVKYNQNTQVVFFVHEEKFDTNNVRQLSKMQNKSFQNLSQTIEEEMAKLKQLNENICFVYNKDIFTIDLTKDKNIINLAPVSTNVPNFKLNENIINLDDGELG